MDGLSSLAHPTAQRLKGKVAIITGGASGFGKATAKLFVHHGAKVVVADVQDDLGLSLCNEIIASINNNNNNNNNVDNENKDVITYIHCNVSDDNDVENLVDHTVSKHGKLDIMFNNAGIFGSTNPSIVSTTNENIKRVFDTNVYGSFFGAKHAARVMIPAKSGVIIFTSSAISVVAGGEVPHAYAMSKHAINGLMKNLCFEMGQYGIRVNAISPSAVSTPMGMHALGLEKEKMDSLVCETNILKGVIPEALDVANAALYLASDEAKFVSGANFTVDGGFSTTNPSVSVLLRKCLT